MDTMDVLGMMEEGDEELTCDCPDGSDCRTVMAFIRKCTEKEPVLLIGKSCSCPETKEVKTVLDCFDIPYKMVLLDRVEDYESESMADMLTANVELPCVFIGGKCIGGLAKLLRSLAGNTLNQRLRSWAEKGWDYHLIVIGNGPGGLAAALEAAHMGKHVAVFYQEWGYKTFYETLKQNSPPTRKTLALHTARLNRILAKANEEQKNYGWTYDESDDTNGLSLSVGNDCKRRLDSHYSLVQHFNTDVSFQTRNTIKMVFDDVEVIVTGQHFVIDIGQEIEWCGWAAELSTADAVYSLSYRPDKALFVGRSVPLIESACYLAAQGVPCHILPMGRLLDDVDTDILELLQGHMQHMGIAFLKDVIIDGIVRIGEQQPPLFEVHGEYPDGTEFNANYGEVIVDKPYKFETEMSSMRLEEMGVRINRISRKLEVNGWDQTEGKTIYALGESADRRRRVGGRAPVARRAGVLLARRLFSESDVGMDYRCEPVVLEAGRQIAYVGLTEIRAALQYGSDKLKVYEGIERVQEKSLQEYSPEDDAEEGEEDHPPRDVICASSYAKIVCVKDTPDKSYRVVGIHLIDENAGEIIQGLRFVVRLGLSIDEMEIFAPNTCKVFARLELRDDDEEEIVVTGNEDCPDTEDEEESDTDE